MLKKISFFIFISALLMYAQNPESKSVYLSIHSGLFITSLDNFSQTYDSKEGLVYGLEQDQLDFKNNIFLEVFGNSGAYSFNYDRIIINDFSIRAGIMILKSDDEFVTAIPALVNYHFGINKNYLETGIGLTFFFLPNDIELLGLIEKNGSIITGAVSYRIQTDIGFNFRISFTPFFYNKEFIPFGGFSFGYSF